MIELPDSRAPAMAKPFPIDFGGWLEPSTGAEAQRIDRKGGRFGAELLLAPMEPDRARAFLSRFLAGVFGDTIKVKWPLMGLSQGSPGTPVVSGAGQQGTSLDIEGLNTGYALKEGYWLTIVDENGRGYLHNCRSNVRVAGDGLATITIAPALRWPFLDGAEIRLAVPTIEGRVPAAPWELPRNRLVQVGFTLTENA